MVLIALTLSTIFAQDATNLPLTPSPAQAITGGSITVTAILGGVLTWLLRYHLPEKDRQIAAMVAANIDTINALLDRHDKHLKERDEGVERKLKTQQETFKETVKEITRHCTEEIERMTEWNRVKSDPHLILPPETPRNGPKNQG